MKTSLTLILIILATLSTYAIKAEFAYDDYPTKQEQEQDEIAKPSKKYYEDLNSAVSTSKCFCNNKRIIFNVKVTASGEITHVKLIIGTETCWDDELKELIKNSSPWTPTIRNGKSVESNLSIPINIGSKFTYDCD